MEKSKPRHSDSNNLVKLIFKIARLWDTAKGGGVTCLSPGCRLRDLIFFLPSSLQWRSQVLGFAVLEEEGE